MKVLTVGCSEGQRRDGVAHSRQTAADPELPVGKPDLRGDRVRRRSQAGTIRRWAVTRLTATSPGVCNFAEPQGNHGLYATPRSIYSLLDRNRLAALYAPINGDSANLLADRGRAGRAPRKGAAVDVARSQSPDREEPDRSRAGGDDGDLLIPAPSLMGIADPTGPVLTRTERKPVAASGTTRRASWQATADPTAAGKNKPKEQTELAAADEYKRAPENRVEPAAEEPRNEALEQGDDDQRTVEFAFTCEDSVARDQDGAQRPVGRPTGKLTFEQPNVAQAATRREVTDQFAAAGEFDLAALACVGLFLSASIALLSSLALFSRSMACRSSSAIVGGPAAGPGPAVLASLSFRASSVSSSIRCAKPLNPIDSIVERAP